MEKSTILSFLSTKGITSFNEKIKQGDFTHFISISDDRICHVRPKAKDSTDKMNTPFGPQLKERLLVKQQIYS